MVVYNLLWFVTVKLVAMNINFQAMSTPQLIVVQAYSILWVLSCTASCYGFFALFSSLINKPRPWLDNGARFAYIMYKVHYVFVTWTQYFLLDISLPAALKFIIVFVIAVGLSMLSAKLILKSPKLASIL